MQKHTSNRHRRHRTAALRRVLLLLLLFSLTLSALSGYAEGSGADTPAPTPTGEAPTQADPPSSTQASADSAQPLPTETEPASMASERAYVPGGALPDGIYTISNLNYEDNYSDYGSYYLRAEGNNVVLLSSEVYADGTDDQYRYWYFEHQGSNVYVIRSVANEDYVLMRDNTDGVLLADFGSNTIPDRAKWVISGNYSLIKNKQNESLALAALPTNAPTEERSDYVEDYYYAYTTPSVVTSQSMYFEYWSITADVLFREFVTSELCDSFSKTCSLNRSQVTLSDMGYELLGSDSVTWSSTSTSVATVDANGTVTPVSCGNTQITATATVGTTTHTVSYNLQVVIIEDGTYFLRNLQTGLYGDVQGSTASNGIEVEQQTFDGAATQKWVFTHVGNNEYTIRSAQNTMYYLGVKNNSTAEEAAIVLRMGTVTSSMRWKIEEGVQGYKIVSCANSSMVLRTLTSNANVGEKLVLGQFYSNTNYRDEWEINKPDAALLAILEEYDRSSYFSTITQNLIEIGYESFNNHSTISAGVTRAQLLNYMREAKIVLLRTHGSQTSVTTSDVSLTRGYLKSLPSDALEGLELVIYGSCLTGSGGNSSDNLLTATVAAGARTAIGFENRVNSEACNIWCRTFFEYFADNYSNSQINYYDVCFYATEESSESIYFEYYNDDGYLVSTRYYVIAGNVNLPNNEWR